MGSFAQVLLLCTKPNFHPPLKKGIRPGIRPDGPTYVQLFISGPPSSSSDSLNLPRPFTVETSSPPLSCAHPPPPGKSTCSRRSVCGCTCTGMGCGQMVAAEREEPKSIHTFSSYTNEIYKTYYTGQHVRLVEIQSTSELTPYFTMTKCNKLFITYRTRSTERLPSLPSTISTISTISMTVVMTMLFKMW